MAFADFQWVLLILTIVSGILVVGTFGLWLFMKHMGGRRSVMWVTQLAAFLTMTFGGGLLVQKFGQFDRISSVTITTVYGFYAIDGLFAALLSISFMLVSYGSLRHVLGVPILTALMHTAFTLGVLRDGFYHWYLGAIAGGVCLVLLTLCTFAPLLGWAGGNEHMTGNAAIKRAIYLAVFVAIQILYYTFYMFDPAVGNIINRLGMDITYFCIDVIFGVAAFSIFLVFNVEEEPEWDDSKRASEDGEEEAPEQTGAAIGGGAPAAKVPRGNKAAASGGDNQRATGTSGFAAV